MPEGADMFIKVQGRDHRKPFPSGPNRKVSQREHNPSTLEVLCRRCLRTWIPTAARHRAGVWRICPKCRTPRRTEAGGA